jgi:hypothetical protein
MNFDALLDTPPRRGLRVNLYDPALGKEMGDDVANDVAGLFGDGPVYFVGLLASDRPMDMQRYLNAFNRLKGTRPQSEGLVLLPKELVSIHEASPGDHPTYHAIPGFPLASRYVDLFCQRAKTIVDTLGPHGVSKFVFYNEPNVASSPYPIMPSDTFASLLYHGWYHSLQGQAQAQGYAGPVHWNGSAEGTASVSTFLDEVHVWLEAHADLYAGFPWNLVTFNNHGGATDTANWAAWRAVLDRHHDPARFAIMEWGEPTGSVCANIAANYASLLAHASGYGLAEMYFYSHDYHLDPLGTYYWGLVEYGGPPGPYFTRGEIFPDRACADPYIG